MQIQVNTANHFKNNADFENRLKGELENSFQKFSERITRIEVHLSDENGEKHSADDKRCMMEVRLAGLQPIAVTNKADDFHVAIAGAIEKVNASLEHHIGRIAAS